MTTQNQHYVPKFILRNFLADERKEQVLVYDKHTQKRFPTSIKNIMAERRFNDFIVGDWENSSFEPMACRIEEAVLPAYKNVIENRRLDKTPEQKGALALLIAFQFLRTKAHRAFQEHLEDGLRRKIEEMGGRLDDIKGWEPLTPESTKRAHLSEIPNQIKEYAQLIGQKDFILGEACEGRDFIWGTTLSA